MCKQLGYPRALSATTRDYIGGGNGVSCLSGIICSGIENELGECQHKNWKEAMHSKKYAVVICQGMSISKKCNITKINNTIISKN